MNPIIGREVRSRWRSLKAFGLVLGYAAPLAIAVVLAYASALPDTEGTLRARNLGRDVFMTLAVVQVLGWMLLAPALTATTIASEREHGLLESLQLSHLTAWQIVSGKLVSALLFMLLVMVAALPVQAICLMMGGVSPGEFVSVFALSLMTALACATIGIACSARARRGGVAFRATFILILGWGLVSFICQSLAGAGMVFLGWGWFTFNSIIGLTSPIAAAVSVVEPRAFQSFQQAALAANPYGFAGFISRMPLWVYNMTFLALLTAGLLWLSTRALRRPLPEQYWIEGATASGTGRSKGRGRRGHSRSWWEVPLLARLNFSNPVLMREARSRFRLRAVPLWLVLVEALLALGVAVFYCYVLYWAIYEPSSRHAIWTLIIAIGFFILMLSVVIMGAGTFSREREAGTWQGIMLCLLPTRDIVKGKAGAVLLTCLVLSVPAWPLLALCLGAGSPADAGALRAGVPPVTLLIDLAIISSTLCCYLAFSMLISWYCRRTATAVGWGLGLLFGLNIFLPMFASLLPGGEAILLFYPWSAIGEASDGLAENGAIILSTLLFHSLGALTAFGILEGRMADRDREKDRSGRR